MCTEGREGPLTRLRPSLTWFPRFSHQHSLDVALHDKGSVRVSSRNILRESRRVRLLLGRENLRKASQPIAVWRRLNFSLSCVGAQFNFRGKLRGSGMFSGNCDVACNYKQHEQSTCSGKNSSRFLFALPSQLCLSRCSPYLAFRGMKNSLQ